ncbi:MAG: hypothetical protein ABSA44_12725 [Bacteroidota bacterium]|jgi:hypothetical protein
MECNCINTFPKKTKLSDITKFLSFLGYDKYGGNPPYFIFYKRDRYKYHSGVSAEILRDYDNVIQVSTWIEIESNSYDYDYQKFTVKELKTRFGGSFSTDVGKNRFPRKYFSTRIDAESGCYIAYTRFQANLGTIKSFLSTREYKNFPEPEKDNRPLVKHPVIVSNNLIVPFLVAATEDYFRSSFVALFQYSDKRKIFLKKAHLTDEDLINISMGNQTVENAVAYHLSFQDIGKICDNFNQLDRKINFRRILENKSKRQGYSLFNAFENIVEHRHRLVHRSRLDPYYYDRCVQRDLKITGKIISSVYNLFLKTYGWQPIDE